MLSPAKTYLPSSAAAQENTAASHFITGPASPFLVKRWTLPVLVQA